MEEVKYAYRLPPCSPYDQETMESWLEDMARNGLLLSREGRFLGFYTFERCAPKEVRYRLVPALKRQSVLDADAGEPFSEEVDIHGELGWDYRLRSDDFFIYCAENPEAGEIHTDPAIQALAIKTLRRRQGRDLIWLVILTGILFTLGERIALAYPLGMAVAVGTPIALAVYGWFLWAIIQPIVHLKKLKTLERRIREGESLNRKKNWRKGAWLYRFGKPAILVLTLAVIYASFGGSFRALTQEVPLAEFPEDPPFVTIEDLSPQGAYREIWEERNRARAWKDWLFPRNYEWLEYSQVTTPEGERWSGTLSVSYHEASSPALAERLARELRNYAAQGKYYDGAEILTLDTEGIIGYTYLSKYGIPTVMLVSGSIVVEAQVQVNDSARNSLQPYWIQQMANRLICE